jgi:hypothetical protein
MTMTPLYPNIRVRLTGQDGNAFSIIGRVREALSDADVPDEKVKRFAAEAMSGNYDHLIQTVMRWVKVK